MTAANLLRVDPELPMELGPRGNSLSPLSTLLSAIALRSERVAPALATVTPGVRLEQLELELYQLLATAAPATWSNDRRSLTRIFRRGRRELRALERRS